MENTTLKNETQTQPTPTIDQAYMFLLDNPECFGYEEWPADMPQAAPEELRRAYETVTEPLSNAEDIPAHLWPHDGKLIVVDGDQLRALDGKKLPEISESDAPEVNEFRLSLSDIADLNELNCYFDDLPVDTSTVPEVAALASVAWYITEEKIREATGYCSSQATLKEIHRPQAAPFTCQCCRYFNSIRHRVERIRRYL